MVFVNEKLTEKDKEFIASFKFIQPIGGQGKMLADIPIKWAADRENGYYLICLGGRGNLDEEYPPNFYRLIIGTDVVEIEARYQTVGNGKTGISITWDIESIFAKKVETDIDLKSIVQLAFESYGNIHFGGHIISTNFKKIAVPYYLKSTDGGIEQ